MKYFVELYHGLDAVGLLKTLQHMTFGDYAQDSSSKDVNGAD